MKQVKNILISRTDSIGDVVLTLPMAKILKDFFPEIKIGFIGKSYTLPVIEACKYVDNFIDSENFLKQKITIEDEVPEAIIHVFPVKEIAKRAKQLNITWRIGTTNRIYHWTTCNKLVKLSRKNSALHEAQLNLKLLSALGINKSFSLQEIQNFYGLENLQPLQQNFSSLIKREKYNVILHPKSQGSAREWGTENFIQLISLLDKNKFEIFISGTAKETELLQPLFAAAGSCVNDVTGLMSLEQFISFIAHCDGLVANSTGPLHIAAALGKDALGLFPPIHPMHPQRWKAIGPKAKAFVVDRTCNDCRKNAALCHCIKEISPYSIKDEIEKCLKEKQLL